MSFITLFSFYLLSFWTSQGSKLHHHRSRRSNGELTGEILDHAFRDSIAFIQWKVEGNRAVFTGTFRSTGWVSIGLSPSGGMLGADMWVVFPPEPSSSNGFLLLDMHGIDRAQPLLDDIQNVRLDFAKQNATHTQVIISRPLITGDTLHDLPIHPHLPVNLIWAAGPDIKPPSVTSNRTHPSSFYKHIYTGGVTTTLSTPMIPVSLESAPPIPNLLMVELRMPNVTNGPSEWDPQGQLGNDNPYICILFEVPHTMRAPDGVAYLQGVFPAPGIADILHHFVLYTCGDFDSTQRTRKPGDAWRCGGGGGCSGLISGWAPGNAGHWSPADRAFAIQSGFLVLEAHYYNPTLKQFWDSSGLRLYFRPQPPQTRNGMLVLGVPHFPSLKAIALPPRKDRVSITSVCPPEFTTAMSLSLPPAQRPYGVNLTSALLHMHERGRAMRVTVERDGRTVAVLAETQWYDFYFQRTDPVLVRGTGFMNVSIGFRLLPGDTLRVVCEYDTTRDAVPVYGGEGTDDEMCYAFFEFHPSVTSSGMALCLSFLVPESMAAYAPSWLDTRGLRVAFGSPKFGLLSINYTEQNVSRSLTLGIVPSALSAPAPPLLPTVADMEAVAYSLPLEAGGGDCSDTLQLKIGVGFLGAYALLATLALLLVRLIPEMRNNHNTAKVLPDRPPSSQSTTITRISDTTLEPTSTTATQEP